MKKAFKPLLKKCEKVEGIHTVRVSARLVKVWGVDKDDDDYDEGGGSRRSWRPVVVVGRESGDG